jgi:hypothetical protein
MADVRCLGSGDHGAVEPPVPIPNTEVKRRSADGSLTTGHARVGRCQVITARFPKGKRAACFSGEGLEAARCE